MQSLTQTLGNVVTQAVYEKYHFTTRGILSRGFIHLVATRIALRFDHTLEIARHLIQPMRVDQREDLLHKNLLACG